MTKTMNNQELNRFIQAIHYLDLLVPLAKSWKPRKNPLNRVRSLIEQLVVLRAVDNPPISEEFAAATLKKFTSLATSVIVKLTPAQLTKAATTGQLMTLKVNGKVFPHTNVKKLLEPIGKLSSGTPAWADVNQEQLTGINGATRGQILRAFSSLSRNTNWTASLLSLGVSVEDAMTLSTLLNRIRGSRVGNSEEYVTKRLATLVVPDSDTPVPSDAVRSPENKPAPQKEPADTSIAQVVVKFSLEALLTQPDIATTIRRIQADAPAGDESLKRFLQAARTGLPVAPETVSLDSAVADALQAVRARLQAIDVDVQAKRDAERAAKAKADKEKLLKELRKLGPALDILKKNPDLLKEI